MIAFLTIVFGILSGCFLSVLVGLVGSGRRLGFSWTFLISLLFSPLVGLIAALVSDPLPNAEQRWGCLGTLVAFLGFVFLAAFLLLLLSGGVLLTAW